MSWHCEGRLLHQSCKGASLQLWHVAAVLLAETMLMDGPADHAACTAEHRRFSGDNLSCIHAASKNEVAYYTNASILKRKEDGKLRVAEEVSPASWGGGAAALPAVRHCFYFGRQWSCCRLWQAEYPGANWLPCLT